MIETKIEELTAAINRLTDAIAATNGGPGATLSPAPAQATAQVPAQATAQVPAQATAQVPAPVQPTNTQQAPAQAQPAPTQVQQEPAQDDYPLSDAELQNLNAELNDYVARGRLPADQIRGCLTACGIHGLAEITTRAKYNEVLATVRAAAQGQAA